MTKRSTPAVTIDIDDDGSAYVVTALPWPTIEQAGQSYVARLPHSRWSADRAGQFVKKLLATYPKVVE